MTALHSTSGDGQLKTFKTFPEFSKLTLDDKDRYEALIAQYPPISHISFPTLMLWWNPLSSSAVALLNDNLVISYWLPGDERLSGLSVAGTNKIDETICTIFDYLQEQDRPARLVNVPEFVVSNMHHPELFHFEGERSLDEYILDISKFYPLRHIISYRRHRIRKFLEHVDERKISVRSIDLSVRANRRLLEDASAAWPRQGTINELTNFARYVMDDSIKLSDELGVENVCLFVDGKLHAFILYHLPADKRHAIFSFAMFSFALPHVFDYAVYVFARWFSEHDILYVNLDVDYNLPALRTLKVALGPANYFRKYTIEPAR